MAFSIRTDFAALSSQRNLGRTDTSTSLSLERLSTGLRINKAADDSSGLVISDSLRSQAKGLGQAIRNANDAISVVQVADAALEESLSILQIIKQKSIQAAQDGQTLESRKSIQSDIQKLLQELDIIAKTTSFNGQKLLSGSFTGKAFQIGAYSREEVHLSIDSAASSQIGHLTTGELDFETDQEGLAYIGIRGGLSAGYVEMPAVDLRYDNSPEHGLGTLADSINLTTQQTGIKAVAKVTAVTPGAIRAGYTDADFRLNQIPLGRFQVKENDADNSLVKAINLKTAYHGISAAVDTSGRMVLTSTDGRGIKIDPPPRNGNGTQTLFGDKDLSTFGGLSLQGRGAGVMDVKNLGGGEPVAVADNQLVIDANATMTQDSILREGSWLTASSLLGYPWTTDQTMSGSQFKDDIKIQAKTTLPKDTTLGIESVILTEDALPDAIKITARGTTQDLSLIRDGSILTTGSILGKDTELPEGNIISAGTLFKGDARISSTLATTAPSQVKLDSILATDTLIASGSILKGTAVVDTAGPLAGTATVRAGSSLVGGTQIASGTTLGGQATIAGLVNINSPYVASAVSTLNATTHFSSGTTLGGIAVVNQIANTTSVYNLAGSSVLTAGSVIASGTTLTGLAQINATATTSGNLTLAAFSRMTTGSVVASGTVLSDNATINATGLTSANWPLAAGSVLRAGSVLGAGTTLTNSGVFSATGAFAGNTTVASGSTLAANTVFGNLSVLNGTATINAIPATGNPGDTMSLADGTILRAGSVIASGDTITTTGGPVTAPAGAVLILGADVTTTGVNIMDLNTGAVAGSSVLASGTIAGNPGFTLQLAMGATADITLRAGSQLGGGTTLLSSSVLGTGPAFTLFSDMSFGNAGTITTNSNVAVNSIIGGGTTIGADNITLASNLNTTGVMTLRAGSSFANASRLNANSVVGGLAGVTLGASMTLGAAMTLESGSTIGLNSSLRQGTVIGTQGATLNANMTTTGVMTIGPGSDIAGGSILNTNSVVGADGIQLVANMAVGSTMTLTAGSTLANSSSLALDSVFPSDALSLISDMTLTEDMTLATDSKMGYNSSITYGSYIWADATLLSSMTLRDPVTLATDMRLVTDLILGAGSKFGENSILNKGSQVYHPLELLSLMEIPDAITLDAGSSIAANKGTTLQTGTVVGGNAVLDEMILIRSDFYLTAGSVLGKDSALTNGSSIGGMIQTSVNEIVGEDGMSVGPGSVLARGSLLSAGTFLTDDVLGLDGKIYERGIFLEEDLLIDETELAEFMTLAPGSEISFGSFLNMNAGENFAAAKMENLDLSTLSKISVLSQESAQQAISLADASISDLDGIRADLGSVQNQLSSVIAGVTVARINVYSSASTIRDVDFSEEVQNLKKLEILAESGKFALSNAAQRSANLIELLTQIDQR